MPANTRELRRRIKSTKSIRQITKAMEMIAASKMRKAQLAALRARPYAVLAWQMLQSLGRGKSSDYAHPFLDENIKSENELFIVITSNRGLCGALNSQIINKASEIASRKTNTHAQYIVIGRKGQRALTRLGRNIIAASDGFETLPTFVDVRSIAKVAMDECIAGRARSATLVYADFISTLRYEIKTQTILPIRDTGIPETSKYPLSLPTADLPKGENVQYLFEPNPNEVLNELLPRLIELQMYQAILEHLASEHSARMVAMKNASDAARDLIQDFTFTYNFVRQSAITSELADITGGRLAMRSRRG